MTRLALDAGISLRTCFYYGAYRSGKTHIAATYPRPAILGSNREGGLLTVAHMDRNTWYEPAIAPQLYAVENMGDLMGHLNKDILPQVHTGQVRTIVIELSFYSDDLIRAATLGGDQTWQKYADLEAHVIALDARMKKVPNLRVVYTALAASEDDKKKPSGVVMAGRALPRKMPALCDLVGYMRQDDTDSTTDHVLHLTAYGNFPAGHRFGDKLPRFIRNGNFRQLEALIQGYATVDVNGVVTIGDKRAPLPAIPGLPPFKK